MVSGFVPFCLGVPEPPAMRRQEVQTCQPGKRIKQALAECPFPFRVYCQGKSSDLFSKPTACNFEYMCREQNCQLQLFKKRSGAIHGFVAIPVQLMLGLTLIIGNLGRVGFVFRPLQWEVQTIQPSAANC